MKTINLKLSIILLIFAVMGTGCEKEEVIEAAELDFKKVQGLSLSGDTCFIVGSENKDFNLVINSQEDFENYFDCRVNFSPQIDFTQNTLTNPPVVLLTIVRQSYFSNKPVIAYITSINKDGFGYYTKYCDGSNYIPLSGDKLNWLAVGS